MPVIEAVVGILIAVLIEIANYVFFKGSVVGHVFAVAVPVGGLLLAIQRHALDRALGKGLDPLKTIASFIDIGHRADYEPVRDVVQSYSSVIEEEFRAIKERILGDSISQLRRLASEKRSPRLNTIDYYDWIFRELKPDAVKSYVHMITLSLDGEWNDSALERNFFEAYSATAQRGVDVVTIFVVSEVHLATLLNQPAVAAHTVESSTPLRGYWVSLNELKEKSPELLMQIGRGFMDFDGRVGLTDMPEPSGALRGEVTMLPTDMRKMETLFSKLIYLSKDLKQANPS